MKNVTGIPCFPNGQPNGQPRCALDSFQVGQWEQAGRPSEMLGLTNPILDIQEVEDAVVIVISCGEDGDRTLYRMTKTELLTKLAENYWGDEEKFAPAGEVPDLDYFVGMIIIDGDIVTPQPIGKTQVTGWLL